MKIEERQACIIENFYRVKRKLVRRLGFTQKNDAAPVATSSIGLDWFKITATEYILGVDDLGDLRDFNVAASSIVTNGTGKYTFDALRSPSVPLVTMAFLDDNAYIGDGVHPIGRFNGTDVKAAMPIAASTAATATVVAGGTLTASQSYSYRIAFLSADGNAGQPGPAVTAATTPGNQTINLSAIPTDARAEDDCAGRVIYRLDPGGTVYFELARIANNVATTYSDTGAVTPSATEMFIQNTRFPPSLFLVTHDNRLYGAWTGVGLGTGDPSANKQTVYISNYRAPWHCPLVPDTSDPSQGTRLPLQGAAAGEITGLCSHGPYVAVFTGGAGFLVSGSENQEYRIDKFSSEGCVSHRTIKSSRGLLIWAGSDGVYAWDGQRVDRISEEIREGYAALTGSDLAQSHSFVWDDKYFLVLPSVTYVFDLRYRQWSINTNWLFTTSCVTRFTASFKERIFAGKRSPISNTCAVYQLETGATDAGTAITARWKSRAWDMGQQFRDKRVHYISVKWIIATGTGTVKLYRGSGDLLQTSTWDLAVTSLGPDGTPYDTSDSIAKQWADCVEQARDEFFTLEISTDSSSTRVELLQAELHWTLAG